MWRQHVFVSQGGRGDSDLSLPHALSVRVSGSLCVCVCGTKLRQMTELRPSRVAAARVKC